jgi:dihydropyrimidinase
VGGVEHRLVLLYDRGVRQGEIWLERLVSITATTPAKLLGLYPQKGTLAVGSDADIVVFDPNGSTTISVEGSPSKVDYSIYEGRVCAGAVRHVFSRGERVVAGGSVVGRAGHGRFLARGSMLAPS